MENYTQVNFLRIIKLRKKSIAEVIKQHKLWKGDVYYKLTEINASKTNNAISSDDLSQIYKQIYDYWYSYIETMSLDGFSGVQKARIQRFLAMPKYKINNMTPEDCVYFMHREYNKYLNGCGIRPIQSQNDNQSPINNNNTVNLDYIHCTPFEYTEDVSCRLYLNIKQENIYSLSKMLMDRCFDNRLRVYFKFWTRDNRNDSFLIYTNYKQVKKIIEILKSIRKENPKIFEGAENINPLLTNIDNFIGFGEEPKYKHSSFNAERAEAIEEFKKDVIEKKIIEERKRIGNNDNTVITSTGENLTIEEYLVYRLEKSFKETIIQHQRNILDRKFPRHYMEYGNKSICSYIEIENKIYRTCMNELPPFVKEQIREQAKRYLEGLKNGQNVYIHSIKFPTKDYNLFPSMNKDYLDQAINEKGKLEYSFKIEIDMQEKLFSVFGSDERIERVITDEALAPYLEKHHISTLCPAINIETEQLLMASAGVSV